MTERLAITGGRLVLPERVLDGHALLVEDGVIRAITPESALGSATPRYDVAGAYVLPGLIDVHTHGGGGRLFNEPDEAAWRTILELQLAHGVTSVLPTTLTAPISELSAALAFARYWLAEERPGAQVLGVHVEGPYFAPEQAGAQNPEHIRRPDDGSVDALLEYADVIRLFTLAPELPGAVELVQRLTQLGVVAAAGHSSARDEHLAAAMQKGLRHIIHLFSAQSTTVREGPWRKPGLLEASLAFDDLTVEVIADLRHLPATLLKLAYKAIGPDRLCIVSDATNGAGLPEGAELNLGGLDVVVSGSVAMLRDLTAFAGSTTLLDRMLQVMHFEVGVPLHEAVRMATLNPARAVDVSHRKGSLTVGKDADIAVFSPELTPVSTIIAGRFAPARER
ncbi:MAG: N-acetylglucosamine-6-phosphate deacetylase [Trueperaceae bacterium]